MAKKTPSSFSFDYRELATLMMRESEVHEGFWQVVVRFRMSGGTFGFASEEALPTGMFGVERLELQRITGPSDQHPPLTFDAAELNPKD